MQLGQRGSARLTVTALAILLGGCPSLVGPRTGQVAWWDTTTLHEYEWTKHQPAGPDPLPGVMVSFRKTPSARIQYFNSGQEPQAVGWRVEWRTAAGTSGQCQGRFAAIAPGGISSEGLMVSASQAVLVSAWSQGCTEDVCDPIPATCEEDVADAR